MITCLTITKVKMTPKAARRAQASFDKQGTPEAQTAKGRVMPVAARRNKKR